MKKKILCAISVLIAFSASATTADRVHITIEEGFDKDILNQKEHRLDKKKSIRTQTKDFISFEQLRLLIKQKKIKNREEYEKWRKKVGGTYNGFLLPSNPHQHYKAEWQGWGYFFGKRWATYKELTQILKEVGITSSSQYTKWRRENGDTYNGFKLPSNPNQYYEAEWKGWDYFFRKHWATYKEFIQILRKAKITSSTQYEKWRKKVGDTYNGFKLPSNPNYYYKEWTKWGHILEKMFPPTFEKFTQILKEVGITSSTQYEKWRKKNDGTYNGFKLPSNPNQYYKEWTKWGHVLEKMPPPTFEEFRQILKEVGITSSTQYKKWRREVGHIYKGFTLFANPKQSYKEEWTGWGHVLEKMPPPTFEEFTQILKEVGITSSTQYIEWRRKVGHTYNGFTLFSNPKQSYKEEWTGWDQKIPSPTFEEFTQILKEVGITSSTQYAEWKREVGGTYNGFKLPSNSYYSYKEWEWKRQNNTLEKMPPPTFEQFRQILKEVGITSSTQYTEWRREVGHTYNGFTLPLHPPQFYSSEEKQKKWSHFFHLCQKVFKNL